MSGNFYLSFFILGFIIGIGLFYFILRFKALRGKRLDEKTFLFKLPLFGTVEAEEQKEYRGIFVKNIIEDLDKIKELEKFMDVDTMLQYAKDYSLNYIGFEGDMDGNWSHGRLAFNTISRGQDGGYNVYLNPSLDLKSVSSRLSEQIGIEINPYELYMFLFLHEVGHTTRAGNENYISAMVNHSLSGGRRSAKRRRMLKDIYLKVEKNADDFAIRELLKIRQKGLNKNAFTEHEKCRTNKAGPEI